jgi:hypothetical protein
MDESNIENAKLVLDRLIDHSLGKASFRPR